MNCKCKICGKILNTKTAYMIARGNNKSYYCSKEEYDLGVEAFNKKKESEEKLRSLLKEIIGANRLLGVPLNVLEEQIEILKGACKTEELIVTIDKKKDWLTKIISTKTQGSSVIGKIKYLSKVLQNKIADWELEEKEDKKVLEPTYSSDFELTVVTDVDYQRRKRRRSLSDLEDELGR